MLHKDTIPLYVAWFLLAACYGVIAKELLRVWAPLEKRRIRRARIAALQASLAEFRASIAKYHVQPLFPQPPHGYGDEDRLARLLVEFTTEAGRLTEELASKISVDLLDSAEQMAQDLRATFGLIAGLHDYIEFEIPRRRAELVSLAHQRLRDLEGLRDSFAEFVGTAASIAGQLAPFEGERRRLDDLDRLFEELHALADQDPRAAHGAAAKIMARVTAVVVTARLRAKALNFIMRCKEQGTEQAVRIRQRSARLNAKPDSENDPIAMVYECFADQVTIAEGLLRLAQQVAEKPIFGEYGKERAIRRFKRAMTFAGQARALLCALDEDTEPLLLSTRWGISTAKRDDDNPLFF